MKLIDENKKNPETKKTKRSMHFANVKMDLEEIAQITLTQSRSLSFQIAGHQIV